MQDVADHVGLSRQLVSIVLRNVEGASDESRSRVLAAAKELGYHPDQSARILRSRRSGQVGVLYAMRQPFDVDLVDALYDEAERTGHTLVLSTVGPRRPQQLAVEELMRQRIEALIVLTTTDPTGVMTGLPAGLPVVMLGGPATNEKHDTVRVDNELGLRLAVSHLVDLGHERISYIGPSAGPNASVRLEGYRSAMEAHGLAGDLLESDYTEEGGTQAARALLERPLLPTAVICGNDRCAIGALVTLARSGIRVPDRISIAGFDDSSAAALPHLDLTSVHPSAQKMAALAMEAVVTRLSTPESPERLHTVTPSLTVRSTTAPPYAG